MQEHRVYTDKEIETSILELKKQVINKRDKQQDKQARLYYRKISKALDTIKIEQTNK